MAAACRYADTGEIATIESGSHDWNGNWADLVQAASTNVRMIQVTVVGWLHRSEARISVMTVVPVEAIITATAASSDSPPMTVTSRVRTAGFRAWDPERAMRKNDASVVASHATYSTMTSLAKTRMSIASAKVVMDK